MQSVSGSVQQSTPRHIKEVSKPETIQEYLVTSLRCSKCTLIFKSKVYLFDHLNKVHNLDVEAALREAGLKYAETTKATTDRNIRSARRLFKCNSCDFKTSSWFILNEHEKECQKTENPNSSQTAVSENPETKTTVLSAKQHSGTAETGGTSLVLPGTSTSETQCTLTLSKDLKTYKRPSQTIMKAFAATSESDGEPCVKLADDSQGSPILHENPSNSSSNSNGVIKVASKTGIDMTTFGSHLHLHGNNLVIADLKAQKSDRKHGEAVKNNVGKRSSKESSRTLPAKKAKLPNETLLENKNTSTQPSCSTEFSFEVSDDEEKKDNLGNEEPQRPNVYFCKHCDYSNMDFRHLCSHYQNDHPYVKYRAIYILSSSDQSATFRCLECPVEFLSTVDLKWHYTEKHPEALDIFKMKSGQFNLVYKCFECPFTANGSNALRQHYENRHPLHQVDNSLLFCRYSLTPWQKGSFLKTQEKMTSPLKSGEISLEKANTPCEKVQDTPSPKHPTSKGTDPVLLKCNNCDFVHKSVVVMHVHYQKSHPNKAIAMDKIRQLTFGTGHTKSEVMPKKESPKKATDGQKTTERFSLHIPEHKPETSKYYSESPQSKKPEIVKVKSKRKMSSTKSPEEMTTGTDDMSLSLTHKVFYCKICDYSNPKLRSVVNHCCSKHRAAGRTTQEDIIKYSAEKHERKLDSTASKQVKVGSRRKVKCKKKSSGDIFLKGFNPYAYPEKLFFCQDCNFGNPTLAGIITHQFKTHKRMNIDRERVYEHTALVRDEIEKSKLDPRGSSFSTRLPLPLMNKGDENKLFCHMCNYRRSSMTLVLHHCYKTHRGFSAHAANIKQYTSVVLKQLEESHLKTATTQEMNKESLAKTESKQKKAKKFAMSPSSETDSTTDSIQPSQRMLQCCKCKYSTQYVFLLKNHMRKTHKSKRSVTDVLKMCFRQGNLQSGYHCEWCVFSHKKAEVVHRHYQEQHPRHLSSLLYVSAELYVGPNTQKKNPKLKSTAHIDGSVTAQRVEENEQNMYSCSICLFKSCSKSSLAHHCHTVHSLLVKEDGSDLRDDNMASVNSNVEDLNHMPGLFESFQVPLEDAVEATSTYTLFKCPSCPACFNTSHGLSIHQGIKHIGFVNEEEQDKRQVQIQRRVHVFKCPDCPYVNTSYQGIFTHSQMKHFALPSTVDSLDVDVTQLNNHDDYMKTKDSGETLKLSGHICKICQKICASQDKLNRHHEQDHNQDLSSSVSNMLGADPTPSAKTLTFKTSSAQRVVCQHCSFSCKTKIGLSHHIRIRHKNVVSKKIAYKCALCTQFFFSKKRLGCHYAKRHGKNAFMKYYVPVCKKVLKKPTAPSQYNPSNQELQNTLAKDGKKLVYRCPKCPYVNRSHHGMLTHSQMKHPALEVRASKLETGEILVGNIVGCSAGRGSYERGYECKTCQQIHTSLKKLKIHCEKMHGEAVASELQTNTERENDLINSSQGCMTQTTLSSSSPGENQSGSESAKRKTLYKCQICTYSAHLRGYLRYHYKKTHKLDAVSTYKLLERYNKRKYKLPFQSANSENIANVKCKQCPDLTFESSQSLIDHYNTLHHFKIQSDFKVISSGIKYNSTGLYKCAHCMKKICGTKKLWHHLDRHKNKAMQAPETAQKKPPLECTTTLDPESTHLCRQDEVPTFESEDKDTENNVTSVKSVSQPSSPQSSPSKLCEAEVEEKEDDGYACDQCKRTFMSLKGLRLHKNSHVATAAIKRLNVLPTTELKHNITRYVVFKSGNRKRLLCSCCSYRTNLMGLWQNHFLKNHQDVLQKDESEIKDTDEITQMADEELLESEKINIQPEFDEEAEESEESVYSEPPDVQRQLNHYTLMAQSNTNSENPLPLPESSLLHCEICNFKTEHLSSIRRHYMNRHGKKILRCKECSFFTGLRRTLEMHMEIGHHVCQSEPSHQKDLCCPFCLYQTKNKNNMIDHIVLHREERVVPIEVRRPKLSRYLKGIIFRCHKCTFTSGSAENLRLHMMRHNDIKPYKCRLCYFDCSHLSELEGHLTDKHQVLRNHELVGQVSLEQLEARAVSSPEREEKHNTDDEDVETQMFAPDSEVPQAKIPTQHTTREEIISHIKEVGEKQANDGSEEISSKIFVLDTQCGSKKSYGIRKRHDQGSQTQSGNVASLYSTRRESSVEQKAGELNSSDVQHECFRSPKRKELSEAQTKLEDKQNEKPGQGTSTHIKEEATPEPLKLHLKTFQQKTLNIQAKVEDDILQHISLMDEDGGICKVHNRASRMQTVKLEQRNESKSLDKDPSDNLLQDKNDNVSLEQNSNSQVNTNFLSTSEKIKSAEASNTRPQKGFRFERHLLTLSPIYPQLKLSHKESFGVSFTNYKKQQETKLQTAEEAPQPDGAMPVLENEYFKMKLSAIKNCKEEEEAVHLEQKQDQEDETILEDHSTRCSDQDNPHVNKGLFNTTDGAAEVLHPSHAKEKRFTCMFCGRSLMTMSELNFHVMRHGL